MKACLGIRLRLSLLQLSSKILILGFFILIVNTASAIELGISPSSIVIDAKNGERCFDFRLYSDREIEIYLEDYWNEERERDVRDYTHSAEDFGITMEYSKSMTVDEMSANRACIIGERVGKYYGLLLARDNERKIGVGMRIEFSNGGAEEGMPEEGARITGAFAGHPSEGFDLIGIMVILQILLMLALAGLLLMLVRKKRVISKLVT